MEKEIDTQKLIELFKLRDRVVRVISDDGKFRVAAIKNTKAALTAQEKHSLPIMAAFLLARSLAAASIMSSFLKGEERITLELEGNGPVSYIYAEAMQVGELRGFVNYDKDLNFFHFYSISELLGLGRLKIVRILHDQKEPLTSIINLVKGDIATDLAYYFTQSEQIPSAVILDVDIDDNGLIRQSGGILMQAMPGVTKDEIQTVYDSLSKIKTITSYYDEGLTPDKMLKEILPFEFNLIGSTPVDFFCRCNKQTFIDKLMTLEPEEIKDMQSQNHNELVCHYCNAKYYLDESDFDLLIADTQAKKN